MHFFTKSKIAADNITTSTCPFLFFTSYLIIIQQISFFSRVNLNRPILRGINEANLSALVIKMGNCFTVGKNYVPENSSAHIYKATHEQVAFLSPNSSLNKSTT